MTVAAAGVACAVDYFLYEDVYSAEPLCGRGLEYVISLCLPHIQVGRPFLDGVFREPAQRR
jgi:hypothetical protein